jgi:glycosyltransferase involved in cell wall biosynthesis
MTRAVSVVITTHNPDLRLFGQTLKALGGQTLDANDWELIIVDNASTISIAIDEHALNCCNWRAIREERLGSNYGRLAGALESKSDLLVFVDDDNVLAPDFLETAIKVFAKEEKLGAAGGIIELEWCDAQPEPWAEEFLWAFSQHNFGPSALIATNASHPDTYPEFSPCTTGMVARRAALASWFAEGERNPFIGRSGSDLTCNEDCDMVLGSLRASWLIGYFPELKVKHLIPGRRLHVDYIARLVCDMYKSCVELMYKYDIPLWQPAAPWTVPLRKIRAYLRCRAWAGPAEYVRWRRACGIFEGRAKIYQRQKVQKNSKITALI